MSKSKSEKEKAIEEIIDRISKGESLRSIMPNVGRPAHLPVVSTFMLWVADNKELSEHYARAMEARAQLLFDEILAIADDGSNDFMKITKGDAEYEIENKEWINRSKVRIDARKWMLGKMNPKKYGDKLELSGDAENPLVTTVKMKLPDGMELDL